MGRFAPSPTGRMHAGNIYASLVAWLIAKSQGGKMILRIEDLDRDRSKEDYISQVMRDYEMLGFTWDEGPYYQHNRDEAYEQAYRKLEAECGVYPCFCSRSDLKAAASAPHLGEKWVYAGTCKHLTEEERAVKSLDKNPSYRLIVPDETYSFVDQVQGAFSQNLAYECGDFLIRRADGMFAYQLAVTVDDGAQGVNSVVRGYDLITSSPQQMFILEKLGYPAPTYAHVPLLVNQQGKRLSKRDKDASIDLMLETFGTVEALMGHIAYVGKIIEREEAVTPSDLLECFDIKKYAHRVMDEVGRLEPIIWQ